MRIIFRSAVLAAMLIAASCGKDDVDTKEEQLEEQAEVLEKTPLAANTVSDNVLIKGGEKKRRNATYCKWCYHIKHS